METTGNKNTATLLQLSALTQYFFPLGNYLFPIIIWSLKKDDSRFVDQNGKHAINFQLSILLYMIVIAVISVPFIVYLVFNSISFNFIHDWGWVIEQVSTGNISTIVIIGIIATFLFFLLKAFEFILILYAAVKNSNGENFSYPLAIKFIK